MTFKNSSREVVALIRKCARSLNVGTVRQLQDFNLTFAQFLILRFVADHPGTNASKAAAFIEYNAGAATRLLDHLEEEGLLRRVRTRQDRRQVMLDILPAGKSKLVEIEPIIERYWESALSGFSDGNREIFLSLLERFASQLDCTEGTV